MYAVPIEYCIPAVHEIFDDNNEPPVTVVHSACPAAISMCINPFIFSSDKDDIDENDFPACCRRCPFLFYASVVAAPSPLITSLKFMRYCAWALNLRLYAVFLILYIPHISCPAQCGSGSSSNFGHYHHIELKGIYLGL